MSSLIKFRVRGLEDRHPWIKAMDFSSDDDFFTSRNQGGLFTGIPVSLIFDSSSRLFNYTYRPNPAISLPTEVFVPPLVYTEGFLVDLSEGLSWTPDETSKNRQDLTLAIVVFRLNYLVGRSAVNSWVKYWFCSFFKRWKLNPTTGL